MALKPKYVNGDEIPERDRSLYVERDGVFLLDIEGGYADPARLSGFRDNNTALKRQIEEAPSTFFLHCGEGFPQIPAVQRLSADEVHEAVRRALAEDVGTGDVTTLAIIHEQASARAVMVAREPLVVAGVELAEDAFRQLAPSVKIDRVLDDGKKAGKGSVILRVAGPARALLTAERVALNFIQRLSGIATLTAQYVAAAKSTSAATPKGVPPAILDTRKTTPGLRRLEKYAVTCGGGQNHRFGLFDRVLIKDNHLAALQGSRPNAVAAGIARARQRHPQLAVEVEADTLEQVRQAADALADFILLDNMSTDELGAAVTLVAGRAKTEASGGVNLQTVRAIAETGVDFISVGALTHSVPVVDIALDFES